MLLRVKDQIAHLARQLSTRVPPQNIPIKPCIIFTLHHDRTDSHVLHKIVYSKFKYKVQTIPLGLPGQLLLPRSPAWQLHFFGSCSVPALYNMLLPMCSFSLGMS